MDLNYGASPSRPTPQPYDDPYSDTYNQPGAGTSVATPVPTLSPHPEHGPREYVVRSNRGRGRERDDHRPHYNRERGRGRGRGHGRGRGRGRGTAHGPAGHPHRTEEHGAHGPRALSPSSAITAQAVGGQCPMPDTSTHSEYRGGGGPSDYAPYSPQMGQFGFAQSYTPQPFVSTQHPVQPHINPRFAEQFGLNLDMMQQQQPPYFPYSQYTPPVYDNGAEGGWDGQWSRGYGTGSDGEHHHEQGQNNQGT